MFAQIFKSMKFSMFKKLLFLSILVILNFRRTNAQSWLKAFGDFAPGSGPGMALETYDMGFLICTETGKPFYNGLLIKTDINGNVLWQKQCDSFLRISRMLSLKDGSIILGGDMYENDSSSYAYVMKLDDCGNPVWGTRLNYCCSYNEVFCLQENIDGDILASCDNYGDQPSILFCFDNKGKFKWKYADNMTIFDILPNINGDILVSGDTNTNDSNLDSKVNIISGFFR